MLKIIDAKLTNPKINSSRELIFTCRVKREDYDQDLQDDIYSLCDNGTPVAIGMQGVDIEQPKNTIGELRAKLAGLMELYAKKENTNIETIKNNLYRKYNIVSRTQLTELQLEDEIRSYKVGLQYD